MPKLLIVEDDPDTVDIVKSCLDHGHYLLDVASNSKDATAYLSAYQYDLLILDWDLGAFQKSGVELLQEFRSKGGGTPALFLTGRGALADKRVGFESGGDDYLSKPFEPEELNLRIAALLRRPAFESRNVLTAGPLALDPLKRSVEISGQRISLRPREFALLEYFMRHKGHVVTVEAIIAAVWPSESAPSDMAVRITIKRIRDHLGELLNGDVIETVHGAGYVFRLS